MDNVSIKLKLVIGTLLVLFAATARAQMVSTPGWHKIPATAVCGGPENPTTSVPDNFPANLGFTSYGFTFASQCNNGFMDSNGGFVDTSRHRLILWGGGHSGYKGNDIWSVELTNIGTTNPVLVHLDYPANPNNIVGSATTIETLGPAPTGLTPTANTPGSRHTYGGIGYLPNQDAMYSTMGATTPNGNSSSNTWLLAMSSVVFSCAPTCNPQWTSLNLSNPPGQVGGISAYDPTTDRVWLVNQNNLWQFNPNNNTWTSVSNQGLGYHSTGVLDPIHHYFIAIGPQGVGVTEGIVYWNLTGAAPFSRFQPTTTGCANVTNNPTFQSAYPGVVWDPVDRRVVIYPNGANVLYILDPVTWTCTTETYGSVQGTDYPQNTPISPPLPTGNGDQGTFGHFGYDPGFDVFILCNDSQNDCWYLHRRRGNVKIK